MESPNGTDDRPVDAAAAMAAFSALSQPMRLDVVRALIAAHPDGLLAGEIAALLDARPSSLSANLNILAQAGLVEAGREGRGIRYRARPDRIGALARFLTYDCCGGRPDLCAPPLPQRERQAMTRDPFNVLFLCTANSARSLIAEAILNAEPSGQFRAFSAGSQPADEPDARTIRLLDRLGYDTAGIRSKSWDEFGLPDAPRMDFVFTVCDSAAAETCPVWPGHPVTAIWAIPDPKLAEGTEAEQATAFNRAHSMLATRLSLFTALPIQTLEGKSLQAELVRIGQTED